MYYTVSMPKLLMLTQGLFALVDNNDYERLALHKWCIVRSHGVPYARRTDYAFGRRKPQRVWMHKDILHACGVVDHVNGDTLDNRKENLRECTRTENARNQRGHTNKKSSQFKGVFRRLRHKHPWYAMISVNGKLQHIGVFGNELDAAKAYNEAALKFHGVFARVNIL